MRAIRIIILSLILLTFVSSYGQNPCNKKRSTAKNEEIIEMEIDSLFYVSGLVCSIKDGPISSLAVTADIKLNSYEGYVRILLCDLNNEQEYLVYEAYYPLNHLNTIYRIEDYAYESELLFNLSNIVVKIEIHNGECYFNKLSYSNTLYVLGKEQFDKDKRQLKNTHDSIMFVALNQRIKEEGFLWVAGATSVSELYFNQRKDMLPKNNMNEIPNLQGFEYYKGGLFEVLTDSDSVQYKTINTSNYVDEFDWRNRHGQNWLTPSKQQQCNHCWVFCPISVAESSVNLYYNQHIDYDLSEQHVASCSGGNGGNCDGGFINDALLFLVYQGVVKDNCFPYLGLDPPYAPCGDVCSNPEEIVSFNSSSSVSKTVDQIKKAVIENGPICSKISSLWHYMSIVGFKSLKTGDVIYDGSDTIMHNMTIQPNSQLIGQTCWLFKNSWGSGWGNNGSAYVFTALNNMSELYKLNTPQSQVYDNGDIICEDNDGDGYYNWGIGPKPATCPNCPDERDCDDSLPTLGPYGADYDCINYCDLPGDTTTIRITGIETWNTGGFIRGNIEVDANAILTIASNVYMDNQKKIIVHTGGKLIVDGGKLTCACNEDMWQGIEVWGDSTKNQYTINGVCEQGRLILKNGAVIENAVCAVELWHPNDTLTTGGIVLADSTVFRNNAKAVHALYYTNHKPLTQSETNYNSSFTNCTFVIDNDYLATETFYQHVDYDNIKGISFNGCNFSVSENAQGISPSNCGITAYNAGFSVSAYCTDESTYNNEIPCPEEYLNRSSFTGFHDAIHSVHDGATARSFSVTDALFQNNDRGIYALNTGFATILRNHFTIGNKADCCYGVYADEVTGFCIEENVFNGGPVRREKYGIGVFNCEGGNDIYLNEFNNLDCGNLAVGQNVSNMITCTPGALVAGLIYNCNQNSDNHIDFCVLKDDGNGGIYPFQGMSTKPAGNTFSGNIYHFYNDSDCTVYYYYYIGNSNQTPSSSLLYGVQTRSSNSENACMSHYGQVPKSQSEKEELEMIYYSASDWHDRYLAAGDIVRSDLHDTVSNPEELRTWLGNMNDISAKRMAIASYIQEGDFDNAFALADELPSRFELEGEELENHSNYMLLLNLYKTLRDTHRTITQMTNSERDMVENINKNGKGFSKSMAKAILERFSIIPNTVYTCPVLPIGSRNTEVTEDDSKQNDSNYSVVVTPNPTSTWVKIDYTLPDGYTKAQFSLFNVLGMEVMNVVLEGQNGNKVIQLHNIPEGVYGYTARCRDIILGGKLIITR